MASGLGPEYRGCESLRADHMVEMRIVRDANGSFSVEKRFKGWIFWRKWYVLSDGFDSQERVESFFNRILECDRKDTNRHIKTEIRRVQL